MKVQRKGWLHLEEVPVPDESLHGLLGAAQGVERAVANDPALEDREPELDLIHPGGMLRRVDELEAVPMTAIELRPPMVLAFMVDVEVVPDDDDPVWIRP